MATAALRLMFGGDVMLGRLVRDAIARHGPDYPVGQLVSLLRQADLAIANLECALTDCTAEWPGAPKAFYFGGPPVAVRALTGAGISLVSLANNHALDFGVQGLLDTLATLDAHGVRHAGAGADASAAAQGAIIDCKGMLLGMAAFCDHQADFAAGPHHPGIAYLDLEDTATALSAFADALAPLRSAAVDWPILSLHWGPNMVWRPAARFRKLAHAAIEMGWKILFGHSAHVFHGIELYHGCPILYAAGDLVDDYYVDPDFRNDHQLLFELDLAGNALRRIRLHAIFIERCRTVPADPVRRDWTFTRMGSLCGELGTETRRAGEQLVIEATPLSWRQGPIA
jgi:poly-gamma-glutamate capsule biosynthesis protein CapA/YwtB (metallophosphatase superfamily)